MALWKKTRRRDHDDIVNSTTNDVQVAAGHVAPVVQLHAEEDALARMPDAILTSVYGWRRNVETLDLEWIEIPVCVACQEKFSRAQFEPTVSGSPNGAWSR
jgi:hypothetical protein